VAWRSKALRRARLEDMFGSLDERGLVCAIGVGSSIWLQIEQRVLLSS